MIGCPLACTFCPQDSLSKSYGKDSAKMMTLETFHNIISKTPDDVALVFSGMAEVFANPLCFDFLKIASDTPKDIYLYTTLNGMTPAAADFIHEKAIEGRLKKLVIHLPDDKGNMPGCKLTDDYWYALNKLGELNLTQMMTMSSDCGLSKDFIAGLSRLTNNSKIKKKLPNEAFVGWSRAGSLNKRRVSGQEMIPDVEWKCGISCASTPFYDQNVVLPDGRVVLCCMDYSMKHVLGNINTSSYQDIVGSQELSRLVSCNMSLDPKTKSQSICTNCHNVQRWEINSDNSWKKIDGIPVRHKRSSLKALKNKLRRLKSMIRP